MSEQRPISERWTIDDMIIVATGKKDSDKATQAIQNAQDNRATGGRYEAKA